MYLTISIDSEHKSHLSAIRIASLAINDELNQIANFKDAKRLEEICHIDFTQFFNEVFDPKGIYAYTAFLNSFNHHKFYSLFLNSNNNKRREMIRFIKERYQYIDLIQSEFIFLSTLKNKFETKCNKIKNSNLSGMLFNNMNNKLQELTKDISL